MTSWDRHTREERPQQRRKTPSFSSTLLDAIYHSTDETKGAGDKPKQDFRRRDNALEVEEEISSLRRAMMIEKWMENYTKYTRSSRQFNSDSSSSTDTSMFSSSGTESASRSTPKSSAFIGQKLKESHKIPSGRPEKVVSYETTPKCEGRFTRTKSRALKIYGDLKKVKQPISPGSRISNFLNSIFNSRTLKKHHAMEDLSSLRKSRSVKDSTTCSFTSRSCLSKAPSPRSKSKRSVRFGPVSVIVGEGCKPCGHNNIYDHDPSLTSMPNISSHFIKENISSLRGYEETKANEYEFRESFNHESDDDDEDDEKSCASSDLFELENIGIVGNGMHREELPVYGTTNLKINQAIAIGLFV